ncbi:MAG: SpaH/EbpB family LPXTG-anchored major pilin, partial [Eubacteriales bacterium]|nr:SpaH/EbpB family LPXTG-anchored major pilin [Eubacteriales bacterium]
TGLLDDAVNNTLSQYAIQGVEFTYVKLADLTIYKEKDENGQQHIVPLYSFAENPSTNSAETTEFLQALHLSTDDAYRVDQDANQNHIWSFKSDTLIRALENALESNSTSTKTALEAYIAKNNGMAMPETDENGKSTVDNMEQGLYLLVETRVPEDVTSTTDPFLVSLPMTTVDGTEWNYDVTVYPKNNTGSPDLEKTVRESKTDTGKNEGKTDDITDGYAHTATASDGDVVEYQLISTLPMITSPATALTTYTFVDTMSAGIRYNGADADASDVVIAFFKDQDCTDKVAEWTSTSEKFKVEYTAYDFASGSSMNISMTEDGLKEINSAETVYDSADSLLRGYSNLTMRITYSCTVNSDASVVYGDSGNPNTVELTWKRTNTEYYDTLDDDCHVYTYGMDLTKEFSDNNGDFSKVQFLMHNTTDDCYVQAELDEAVGVYYVTGHTTEEAKATAFSPMSGETNNGKIVVKGLEDDTYVITETETDRGYSLLKEDITVVISAKENDNAICDICGKALLTASAEVNGKAVQMAEDGQSVNAIVPLTVINTAGFTLPKTGGNGIWMYAAIGVLAIIGAGTIVIVYRKKRKNRR